MVSRDQYFNAAQTVGQQQSLSSDDIKVLFATLTVESGWTGTGDLNDPSIPISAGAHGPLQFFGPGGQLDNFARSLGVSLSQAGAIAFSQPERALTWALQPGGYYRNALEAGKAAGLRGPDLAYYVQHKAQNSANDIQHGNTWQRAYDAYVSMFGFTGNGPLPAPNPQTEPGTTQEPGQVPGSPAPAAGGGNTTPQLDFNSSWSFIGTKILLALAMLVFLFLGIYLLTSDKTTTVNVTKDVLKDGA